jgi:hypothetical protein
MTMHTTRVGFVLTASLAVLGCKDEASSPAPAADTGVGSESGGSESASDDTGTTGEPEPERASVTHSFGIRTLAPRQESEPCIQWTLHNDHAIYIEAVTLANDGGFHHSNWFVVPEQLYPGEDGYFGCWDRGFTELEAAVQGTVLTAQSTQSRYERMELPPGVVIKVPPRHKLVAGGHLLNLADADYDTELRVTLDIVHPRHVEVVAAPFRLTYYDLEIPPFTEARFTSTCDLSNTYQSATGGGPLDLRLYYVLPHYHYLGNYFDLTIHGGPRDGESVFRLDGFNAAANGAPFPDPIDLTGANGFTFTCGFDNWTDKNIGWGIGDQEMCVILGLADSRVLMDGIAGSNQVVGTDGEILLNQSSCNVLGLPKSPRQGMPTAEELAAPLYVPPSDPGDAGLPPVDDCDDVPASATPSTNPTLTKLRDTLFVSTCQFSSCHGGGASAAGLDLMATNLHAELMGHAVQATTNLPLVAPGNPEGSWLYQVVAKCRPTDAAGSIVSHMPLNSPRLSDPGLVAALREWIAAGARDD